MESIIYEIFKVLTVTYSCIDQINHVFKKIKFASKVNSFGF